jgi:hypothetical protein
LVTVFPLNFRIISPIIKLLFSRGTSPDGEYPDYAFLFYACLFCEPLRCGNSVGEYDKIAFLIACRL